MKQKKLSSKRKIKSKNNDPISCDLLEYLVRTKSSKTISKGYIRPFNKMEKVKSEFEIMKEISEKLKQETNNFIKQII